MSTKKIFAQNFTRKNKFAEKITGKLENRYTKYLFY